MTQEEFKKFDEFQKKHYAYIEDKLIKLEEEKDPDWLEFGFLGAVMGLELDILTHIKRMYDFGYTSAEKYWSEFEKKNRLEERLESINEMFPNNTHIEPKGYTKIKVQDSLNDYYRQGYPFLLEWKEMKEKEYKDEERSVG